MTGLRMRSKRLSPRALIRIGRKILAITRCLEQFLLNCSLRMRNKGHYSTSGQIFR